MNIVKKSIIDIEFIVGLKINCYIICNFLFFNVDNRNILFFFFII